MRLLLTRENLNACLPLWRIKFYIFLHVLCMCCSSHVLLCGNERVVRVVSFHDFVMSLSNEHIQNMKDSSVVLLL